MKRWLVMIEWIVMALVLACNIVASFPLQSKFKWFSLILWSTVSGVWIVVGLHGLSKRGNV